MPQARHTETARRYIHYRAIADGVQIVRVLHGARDIGSDLFSEGIA